MWVLDPGNSRELLDRLRPHSLSPDFELVWCGEGWKSLVNACHDDLVAEFPEYRFYAIKQKSGALAFQARPRSGASTKGEQSRVNEITRRYWRESESTCEWCSRPGSLREDVDMPGGPTDLTLCDRCRRDLETSPYPSAPPAL